MPVAMEFSRGKFKELVVYLCAASERAGDEGFGMVKLNKLLYRADFEAYRLLGHPITGETYEKQEFGPVARDLPVVLDELGAAARLRWEHIPRGPHTRDVPKITDDPDAVADMTAFPPDEREVIENTLRELAVYGGKGVSEWSHEESAGWKAAPEYGHAIDYASTFISTEPISSEDLARARDYVRERGWLRHAS
jgi:uncharacterized phage-associated protein